MAMEPVYDWSKADWAKRDIEIAELLGCSRERVRQVRRALGHPDPPRKRHHRVTEKREQKVEAFPGIELLTDSEIRDRVLPDLTPQSIGVIRKRLGIKKVPFYRQRLLPRHLVNWDLPNKDIREAWGVGPFQTVPQTRHDFGLPPAKWDVRCKGTADNPEYRKAVAMEWQKAAAWRASLRKLMKFPSG